MLKELLEGNKVRNLFISEILNSEPFKYIETDEERFYSYKFKIPEKRLDAMGMVDVEARMFKDGNSTYSFEFLIDNSYDPIFQFTTETMLKLWATIKTIFFDFTSTHNPKTIKFSTWSEKSIPLYNSFAKKLREEFPEYMVTSRTYNIPPEKRWRGNTKTGKYSIRRKEEQL